MGLVATEQIKETVILLWLLEYFISEDLALMHKFPLFIFYWFFNLIFQGECLYCSIYCARRRYQKKAPNGPNKTLLTSWLSFGAFRLDRYWTQFFFNRTAMWPFYGRKRWWQRSFYCKIATSFSGILFCFCLKAKKSGLNCKECWMHLISTHGGTIGVIL